MFPAATAVTVARNVARRGVFSHFCLCVQVLLSLATFSHGLSRSAVMFRFELWGRVRTTWQTAKELDRP